MRTKVYVFLFVFVFLPFFVFAQETLTITTYYPSPYGSYRQLSADQIAIGSTYRNPTYADGTLYVQGNVGIGTASPQAKLDLGNNWITPAQNVVADTNVGITWYTPSPTSYGIYRTSGAWTVGTYQQLKMQFDTGIQLGAGTGVGTGYDKSYVEVVSGKGLMVTSGNVGIGTVNPGYKFQVYIDVSNEGHVDATGAWARSSDIHYKKNISDFQDGLSKIMKLRAVRYDSKTDLKAKGPGKHLGFIGQEMEKVIPELVSTDSKGHRSIAYGDLTIVLTKAIQEQQKQIEEQAHANASMRKELDEIKTLLKNRSL